LPLDALFELFIASSYVGPFFPAPVGRIPRIA
jgi:hypothetical protein